MNRNPPHWWTNREDAYLRKNYRAAGAQIVAEALGLSPQQVRARAHHVGIRQSRPLLGRPFAHGYDIRRNTAINERKQRVEIK